MRRVSAAGLVLVAVTLLAGCDATKGGDPAAPGTSHAVAINLAPDQNRLRATKVASIADTAPAAVRQRGTLLVGGTIDNTPPLSCYATDNKTPIGFEYDVAVLVGDVLGLKTEREVTSWENLFLGVDSGRFDLGFSNIAVTEARKQKYDFATYRQDLLAVEARSDANFTVTKPADLAGKTVALNSGTNQEQVILRWSAQDKAAGLQPITIQYYQKATDYYLALQSGRVDAYVGPNPTASFHALTTGQSKVVGVIADSKGQVASLVAAMSKKDSGMAAPVAAAIDELIRDGKYAELLGRWGLSSEAVPKSLVNPEGPAGT
ncbi:ABC transporter substrate-binding protein [Kutzneria sp. 744]|uniref:ABC transporter substrate-binding protein n=1 Tax=Kutzneria sp. (strain 744) TaxID=345341 RepID=UPI0003EEABB4|nr:ABC transporter substrate-binding protein [Kutzneria sp. 744]EWM18637.1 amino acid ABC transporter periplasmic amino acid-binding protein [Kutzneria sp. 744]